MTMATKQIEPYLDHESPHIRNRAGIVLSTLAGNSVDDIAHEFGVSAKTVQKWQKAWAADGLSIFPELLITSDEPKRIASEIEFAAQVHVAEAIEKPAEVDVPLHKLEFPEQQPILPTDVMAEAARKIMLGQLGQMLAYESIARTGDDLEGIHKMRVATRRWRSAYGFFGDYLSQGYFKKLPKLVKKTADHLGAVRDLDVFLQKTDLYIERDLKGDTAPLKPLMKAIQKDQKQARKALLNWLDNKDYRQFVKAAFKVLIKPVSGDVVGYQDDAPVSYRVSHVLPGLIYECFEAVRRYEDILESADINTLHSLRIDFKRLRYVLEFFADVLGEASQLVLAEVKIMQDHLGDMNDADVAVALIRAVEKSLDDKKARSSLKAYRQARQSEINTIVENFPAAWAKFNRQEVREALALSVSVL